MLKSNTEFIGRLTSNQTDLLEKLQTENELLEKFLPKKLEGDKLRLLVESKCAELNIQNMSGMGQIMGFLKKEYSDFLIDGGEVKQILISSLK